MNRIAALIISMIAVMSCKKKDIPKPPPEPPVVVRVPHVIAGSLYDNVKNQYVAGYWKEDSSFTSLTNGLSEAHASGAFVDDKDIYISGIELDKDKWAYIAKYWKNGQSIPLTDGRFTAMTTGIFVSKGDVYVCGYQDTIVSNTRYAQPRYWKNGQPIDLSPGQWGQANAIFVSGSDVYVAGFGSLNNDKFRAQYWKNGVPVILTPQQVLEGNALSIAVKDEKVYVAGIEKQDLTGPYRAKLWKDGTGVLLPTISTNATSFARSVTISDSNYVYVSGDESGSITYWKNEVPFRLTDGSNGGGGSHIFHNGKDLYVTGIGYTNSSRYVRYWKNGKESKITNGSSDAYCFWLW